MQPSSPAAEAGLVWYFDFIVAANGIPLRLSDTTFVELIKVIVTREFIPLASL